MCWELLTANRKATSARESVLNTRPFMEATRLLGRFKNLGRSALCQCRQLSFRNGKLRQTAIQANHDLWKYPYGGFAWIAVWRSLPFRKLSCLHWQRAL